MSVHDLDALARRVGEGLAAAGLALVTAESCTGGEIAAALTSVPGSSGWFDRGFVAYSDAAKRAMLGVAEATIAAHGAVSEPTVREMAEGALRASEAGVAVAVSGVAGPGGGSAAKPVGTVCLGWAIAGGETRGATRRFEGDRAAIRAAAVRAALEGVVALVG